MAETIVDVDLLSDLVSRARTAGADAADALMVESAAMSAACRMAETEAVERSESRDLGLRVFVGKRQAVVSTTDLGRDSLAELLERAMDMARLVPEDPYCGLADADRLARDIPALDLADPGEPTSEQLVATAAEAEGAAMAVEGVTNSEGGEAEWHRSHVALADSQGFGGAYAASRFTTVASVVAGSGTGMERDYDYSMARHRGDLTASEAVGRSAGTRAVRRLKPRKVASGRVPVLFDPRVSGGLLRLLARAISGTAIARGTSFLKHKLDRPVFDSAIRIIDDPLRRRGLGSRPFDGEGVAGAELAVVEDGRLATWLIDSRSARQLNLATTGHAARSVAAPPSPSPTNFYMAAGDISQSALIGEVDQGFYVTEMMGMGFNLTTGDYSRGASGFWIDKGELAFPVSEVTVAGNLTDMFAAARPADDLEFRYGTDAPTLRIDGMTVAGL